MNRSYGILLVAAGVILGFGVLAMAQQPEVVPPENQDTIQAEEKLPDETLPVDEGHKGKRGPKGGVTEVQEEHTVIPGDNLWDLCSKYLNNPWYWPRVWSYNPEISNPHWIYPGQKVRFYPGAGELPSEIEVGREFEVPEQVGEEPEEEVPGNLVEMSGRIVQAKKVQAVMLHRVAFVTEEELEASGTIKASPEEMDMLAENGVIYVEFKDPGMPKVGQKYSICRTQDKIYHPVTGKFAGYYTAILGVAQVARIDEKLATLVITSSMEPIYRGDKVVPYSPDLTKNIAPKPNAVELKGYILGSQVDLTDLGESHLVFLDQGKQQGVEEGNVFDVVRRGDGNFIPGGPKNEGYWDKTLPMEVVGRILVVETRPTASTGLVMASIKELHAGDRVLMSIR